MNIRAFISAKINPHHAEALVSDASHGTFTVSNWARRYDIKVNEDKGPPYALHLVVYYNEGDPNKHGKKILGMTNGEIL